MELCNVQEYMVNNTCLPCPYNTFTNQINGGTCISCDNTYNITDFTYFIKIMYCPGQIFNLTAITNANGSSPLVVNSTDYKTNINSSTNNNNGTVSASDKAEFKMWYLAIIIPGGVILIAILIIIICCCCCKKEKEEPKFSNIEQNKDTDRPKKNDHKESEDQH